MDSFIRVTMAENELLRTMNMLLVEQQDRDVEYISELEKAIASYESEVQSIYANKIFDLKRELDLSFIAKETSDNLLEITKDKLKKSKDKNRKLKEENEKLESALKKYTDKEKTEKTLLEMHLNKIEEAKKTKEKDRGDL